MSAITLYSTVDTSEINRLLPRIVEFGRRTLREQCVTSAAFIAQDAQQNTPAVGIGQIDAELQVDVVGLTAKGRKSRAKYPATRRVTIQKGVRVPLAVLIVMARTNPNSAYSRMTGNRWPLSMGMLPTGKGTAAARQAIIAGWISRMTMARHSTTHFLQHGWAPVIRTLLSDPAYYAGKSKMRINAQTKINPLNTLTANSDLGRAIIELTGDQCVVMGENAVGEGGNAVLDEKHRQALILHGTPPLQEAINREAATMDAKLQSYIDRQMAEEFPAI